jgi:predicted DNA repair protein MutK
MASGIFALLDDIAVLADDVAMSTKVATQKTAAILGDDLAVNAQKATGFKQNRELAVIWAITKGAFLNKIIILPLAFLLSIYAPFTISYILIIGGLYLLYEGTEKIEEFFLKHKSDEHEKELQESTNENVVEVEKQKIKSAVMTDFILSIEIVILALGTVLDQELMVQVAATTFVAFAAVVFVYGLVAMIVRMDNVGFWLIEKEHIKSGTFLVSLMPKVIKFLSVVGTIAMILVGGGILSHNVDFMHHMFVESIPAILNEFLVGLFIGAFVVVIINTFKRFRRII